MSIWLDNLMKPSPTNAPPAQGEQRRNDLWVAGLVLFSLVLGFGIRNQVYNASRSAEISADLPKLAYPVGWIAQKSDSAAFAAFNPGSSSIFDTEVAVNTRPQRDGETLELARADWGIKQATALPGYRELDSQAMRVYRNSPALVTTYAYIADPTLEAGAIGLPVVVQAQDIVFVRDGQVTVVTVAADAAAWDEEQRDLQIIFNSLKLEPAPEGVAPAEQVSTPGAPRATAPAAEATSTGSFSSDQADATPEEGGN